MSQPTRRALVIGTAALAGSSALPRVAAAQTEGERETHGLSAFDDLKYPADFKHFDYVNPNAPKGGSIVTQITSSAGNQNFLTFNSLNIFILKGDGAAGMGLTFDALMAGAADEPDSLYGLVARAVRISADRRTYRFLLRPEARFHDGTRLTARDVAFSINTLRTKGHPSYVQAMRDVEGAAAEGEDAVTVRFAERRSRTLPLLVAGLPIFSERYYQTRNFEETTLEPPLGSGGYKVGRFEQGRFISFERVKDYWAKDLPVSVGQGNFDEVRFEYFREREAGFQAFSAGSITFREEFTSRIWATRYDFPALREGRVKKEELPDDSPSGAQGWFINLRRDKFKDPRIREAIGFAFDFEWTNQNIMYSSFRRLESFFENSPMKAVGKPSPEELAVLEPFREKLRPDVFGEPYRPPVSDGSGKDRNLLRQANQLLAEAGCKRDGGRLLLPDGQPLAFEFLDDDGVLEAHTNPFISNLRALGIQASFRIVDPVQYQRRLDDFDFDVIVRRLGISLTPGEGLRNTLGSAAAGIRGSQNLGGIADPVVDALVDQLIAAETRPEVYVIARALDRVLRAGRYWIPMWYQASNRIAYWDLFERPPVKPAFGGSTYTGQAIGLWWYNPEKAKRIGRA